MDIIMSIEYIIYVTQLSPSGFNTNPSRHTDVVSTLKQRRLSTLKQRWKMFDFVIELTSDFNVESTSSFNVETTSSFNVETTSYLNVETTSGLKKILKYILNVPQWHVHS